MTFRQLQKISAPHYYCLLVDRFLAKRARSILRKVMAFSAMVSFFFSFDTLPLYFGMADGAFFLFVIGYLVLFFIEVFYRSMLSEGLRVWVGESLLDSKVVIDHALSEIVFATDEIDVSRAFFENKIGLKICARLGISKSGCQDFIYAERSPIMATALDFGSGETNLSSFAAAVYDVDRGLQSFLTKREISKEAWVGAAREVMHAEDRRRRRERFWSRENLGRIPSIGTMWSYKRVADLGKYARPFLGQKASSVEIEDGRFEREVATLESSLESRLEANVIMVGDSAEAREVVGRLLKRIKLGVTLPSIELKTVFELNWRSLLKDVEQKDLFEKSLSAILTKASALGQTILYIEDLPSLVSAIRGTPVNGLLQKHLGSSGIQIIASANEADFHFFIESNPSLSESFEKIAINKGI